MRKEEQRRRHTKGPASFSQMNSSVALVNSSIEPSETFFLVSFSAIAALILLGMVIALVYIVSIRTNKSLQSVASLLSCNSCAVGLFYFIFHIFYVIWAYYPLPTYRENSTLCYFIGYMYSVTCCGISWSHAVLATNRLCFSLLSNKRWLLTYTFAWRLIFLHWLITFLLPLPLVFFDAYQYQPESRICILTTRQTSTSTTGVFLFYNIPLTMMLTVYLLIWFHARSKTNKNGLSRTARDLAIMRHILTLVVIDIVCGHPYMTLIILDYLGKATKEWYLLVSLFITLSVTANMFAIFIFHRKLRNLMCSTWICWSRRPSHSPQSISVPVDPRSSTRTTPGDATSPDLEMNSAKHEIYSVPTSDNFVSE